MTDKNATQALKLSDGLTKLRAGASHRILVAEDDKDIRRLNVEVLTSFGYHVNGVEDGAAAWEILQRHDYDLLVTDNEMPTLSGLELLHKLRAARKSLPVIMATGTLPMEELSKSPWLHPAVLLPKPYTVDELLGTVKDVLSASAVIPPNPPATPGLDMM